MTAQRTIKRLRAENEVLKERLRIAEPYLVFRDLIREKRPFLFSYGMGWDGMKK